MTDTARRVAAHADTATSLALLGDAELAELVAAGEPLGTGIGGRAVRVTVEGRPVFVKRVPVTDRERDPRHARSTENLFALPAYCHYGIGAVGSPGYGAWRELAAHQVTTGWVLSGRFAGFPLLHHWRVLPDAPAPLPEELADVDRAVAYWGGSTGVRERIEALREASATLTLFLERFPGTLHDWLDAELRTDRADAACVFTAHGLEELTAFLARSRLLHLDAHFGNILTDGRRLYLTDFGLSLSSRFRLASDERDFFARHRHYDRVYTVYYLVIWLVTALYGYRGEERAEFVRACAGGARPEGIPRAAADLLVRHAPLAAGMEVFCRRLERESRLTPFPYPDGHSSCTLSA
ncbi:MAG: protein kinase family protein [Streptomyces sp.]|uniref:protein kinase family protein n=1 Tax=Streptomyces sp. TaxID=1931 RepID=UPI0025D1CB1B|nr:protein kinase family protein [Streptomyces sp.]MBW8796852.1 protein kinase family protein [Streptomyces sp.]